MLSLGVAVASFATPVDFNRDIQPILSENCYHCHGPDGGARKAKLRLDRKDGALKKNEDGVAIITPGHPEESDLITRIFSTDRDEVMPTPKSNRTLTEAQKQLLKRWVEEGAVWGEHWAFIAPKRPAVPGLPDFAAQIADLEKRDPARAGELRRQLPELAQWPQNPIDNFVLARLLREGLTPSPEAASEKLIRRATLDLTGLPPTLTEVDAFAADVISDRQSAISSLTARLLASPRYGERMVWDWLDAARYADTNGYQGDPTRAMWPWRDWAIKALNDNMPFDQFTVEQLAGDMLPNPTRDQLIATGFHRNHMINGEGGRIPEESRVDYVQDRVETTATVWLGLTMTCCRCHDHKFDPITQREYYQLSAYFNSIDETGGTDVGGYAKPIISLTSPEEEKRIETAKAAEAKTKAARDALEAALRAEQAAWEVAVKGDGAKPAEIDWQVLKVDEATSEKGATLTVQPDGSVLASGTNPDTDDLIVTAVTQMRNATALRLEVLPDDSLASKGPGRAPNGSWVLTELKFLGDGKPVGLAAVRADFEQPGWPLKNALDGKDDTGWGAWPQVGQPHEAVFELLDGFGYRPDRTLSFRLQFRSTYKQHVIGRFRLSITDSPKVLLRPIPDDVKAALAVAADQRSDAQKKTVSDFYLASDPRLIAARKAADDAKNARENAEKASARTMVMRDRDQPRDTFILVKGAYDKFADKVAHGTPAVLPALPADAPPNRLALARWLVSPEHPLTARVTVNRYWQLFFGRGLVKTVDDFGVQGDKPTHPELLDWLAREFIESGWDVKHLHRLIVTSATYRQSSAMSAQSLVLSAESSRRSAPEKLSTEHSALSTSAYERDPENQLLARGPRYRWPSWMLRDQALTVSGLLVEKIGGAPTKVYQPANVWEDATFGQIKFTQDHGDALYRRSLYIFWRRIVGPTLFFDVSSRQNCAVKGGRTNTPLHALVTLNDVTYVEAARALAERMLNEGGGTDAERVSFAFRRCTAHAPSDRDAAILAAALARFRQQYRADPEAAKQLIATGESKPDPNLPAAELAAHTSLALLLLNLDETLSKE